MAASSERERLALRPLPAQPDPSSRPPAASWLPPLWGLGLGLAAGIGLGMGCASSDQMLQKRRLQEGESKVECRPGIAEDCYTGSETSLGRGACKAGRRTCKDDSTLGECVGQVVPGAEACNNVDDDCDGIVDNGFERDGALCEFASAKGACRTQGKWHCSADGAKSECDAPIVKPQPETCDTVDNDCDGEIDEDSVPSAELSCTTGKAGVCGPGTNTCVSGRIRCVQNVQPGPEICNGLDDNCDNQIDNDCIKQ